jgi:hypothetical protein
VPLTNPTKTTADILARFNQLPDDAYVPASVVAILRSISEKTVRRRYPSVQLSPGRKGYRVGELRKPA